MRKLFILLFLANVAVAVISLFILPSKVAVHFGIGGMPDSWASKEFNALFFILVELPMLFIILYASPLTLKIPPKFINLPNKDYWLREENRPRLRILFDLLMLEFGSALFAFLLCVELLALKANLSDPVRLDEKTFIIVLILFLLYTTYWVIKLYKKFRVPDISHTKIS